MVCVCVFEIYMYFYVVGKNFCNLQIFAIYGPGSLRLLAVDTKPSIIAIGITNLMISKTITAAAASSMAFRSLAAATATLKPTAKPSFQVRAGIRCRLMALCMGQKTSLQLMALCMSALVKSEGRLPRPKPYFSLSWDSGLERANNCNINRGAWKIFVIDITWVEY
jgi:hypothetical protein